MEIIASNGVAAVVLPWFKLKTSSRAMQLLQLQSWIARMDLKLRGRTLLLRGGRRE